MAQNTYNLKQQVLKYLFLVNMLSVTVRSVWIARINAAARQNGLSYSKLMHGLKVAGIDMNRKMLADIAYNDEKAFADLADAAKKALN